MHDAFINSVKEADSLRVRDAKGIMSLSKEDSAGLWKAIQTRMSAMFIRTDTYLTDPQMICNPFNAYRRYYFLRHTNPFAMFPFGCSCLCPPRRENYRSKFFNRQYPHPFQVIRHPRVHRQPVGRSNHKQLVQLSTLYSRISSPVSEPLYLRSRCYMGRFCRCRPHSRK